MPREVAGRYQIQRKLGAGAWATVYEALDTGAIERRVAIKIFRLPPLDDSTAHEEHARFRQGARAAGRLTHPNIVSVFDYGENEESAWIVMELVEGGTLKALIDSGERPDTATIARIMGQILDALSYTHSRGVVHRDIKPANIMLTRDRVVKITDFGVARIEDSSMTHAGTILGSPSYMAPEQFRGDPVDHRADIWAAGVILYQLLTGERPFEGSATSVMQKALYVEPVLPSRTRAAVPVEFDAVVTKALAKRAEARFGSAMEFTEALRMAAAAPKPGQLPPRFASADETGTIVISPEDATLNRHRRRPPPRRRRSTWAMPAALAAGAAVVLGAAAFLVLPPKKERANLVPAAGSEVASLAAAGAGSGLAEPLHGAPGPVAAAPAPPAEIAPPPPREMAALEPAPVKQQPEPMATRALPASPAPPPPVETAAAPVLAPVPAPPQLPPERPLPDLRQVAMTAGAAFQCGAVAATLSAEGIVFRGVAPWGEIQAAQRAIAAAGLPPWTAQMQAVAPFDPTYCGVLGSLGEAVGAPGAPQLALVTANPLPAGQVLRVRVQMPDWPAHLALFVLMPQGQAALLVGTGRNAARAEMLLTDPSWEVAAPFGSELLIAIATERPLFAARRRVVEPLDSLSAALAPALRAARENGGRAAAHVIALNTVPP